MSYRRDIADKDYPTEFYEKLLIPEEEWLAKHEEVMRRDAYTAYQKFISPNVLMERTYLNGWRTFYERSENLPSIMTKLLDRNDVGREDIYTSLRALNTCCFDAN